MHFDFAAFLVLLTALTGGIWGAYAVITLPRRRALAAATANGGAVVGTPRKEPLVVEYARSFFPVILIVLLIRSFLAEPFRIPSGSMIPTLLVGDLILVNKFSYGLRLPVTNTKILDLGDPERGDVVVFRYPVDESKDFIKRVVGVPGDVVEFKGRQGRQLYLNGEPVRAEILGPFHDTIVGVKPNSMELVEYLPGKEHHILMQRGSNNGFSNVRYELKEGEYFVMGDNRDNSEDSRFWGIVPEDHLVGKAFLIWMHLGFSDLDRVGTVIK